MRSSSIMRSGLMVGALIVCSMAATVETAVGATYVLGACRAGEVDNSRAFTTFATRGMTIKRQCVANKPGLDGIVTGAVFSRGGKVERGALSRAALTAPPGTQIVHVRWGFDWRRADCRYALRLWVENAQGDKLGTLAHRRANRDCEHSRPEWRTGPRRTFGDPREQFGVPAKGYPVPPSAKIVQQALCVGKKGSDCSASGRNWIRTTFADVTLADVQAPTASILPDTPLARGEWVNGLQALNYNASDNVGVRQAEAVREGVSGGVHPRPCSFASPEQVYADPIPCPNGPGTITVNTGRFTDGSRPLAVQIQDPASNVGTSAPIIARIDKAPPARVAVALSGGERWRNRNDFSVAWVNPREPDRAPIAGITYQLCAAQPGTCRRARQNGANISRLALRAPGPGEWKLSLWRRDAAGNEADLAASVPVTLRFDPEPPTLAFEPPSASDPTLVGVAVTETVSGLAGGAIEISASGSGIWHALPTQQEGTRLTARIDDTALPAGAFQLRARAYDHAGNEASTDRRIDGASMALTLPLRIGATMRAGFEQERAVPRRGNRKGAKHRRVLNPAIRVRLGREAQVAGRLVNRQGDGIGGAEVRVLSSSSTSPEQLVAVLRTDSDGRYRYTAAASSSRALRFVYSGSPLTLPAEHTIRMTVPARTSLRVTRKRVLNGQAVTFSGRLRTQPPPPGGKLVELQARLSDRWQTFRTTRTNDAGRWSVRYRFKRTRGVQQFRFRARLPEEASYPFAAGRSPRIGVRVRGQ